MLASFIGICGAALLYRLYNQHEFEKYSAKKLKDEQKAKQKMEYQKFLSERRHKRYFLYCYMIFSLEFFQRFLKYCACFLAGYLYGVGESEFHRMQLEDGAAEYD